MLLDYFGLRIGGGAAARHEPNARDHKPGGGGLKGLLRLASRDRPFPSACSSAKLG